MRSLKALRLSVGLLALAALLAGGLLGTSRTGAGQAPEELPPFILAVNYADNSVSFINLLERQTVANIRVCRGPIGIALHPSRLYAYVVCWDTGAVFVIRTDLRRVVWTLTLGGNLYSVAFRPDGEVAYIIDGGRNRLIALDTRDPERPRLFTRLALSGAQAARNLDFSPDGQQAFITDSESDRVWVIDAQSHQVEQILRTGGRCGAGIRVSHSGDWIYVADRCLATVYAIERVTWTITPIPLTRAPGAWHIAFSFDDLYAYVTRTEPRLNLSDGKISVIDTITRQEVRMIEVGGLPASIQTFRQQTSDGWTHFLAISDPTRSIILLDTEGLLDTVVIPTGEKTIPFIISCPPTFAQLCQDKPPRWRIYVHITKLKITGDPDSGLTTEKSGADVFAEIEVYAGGGGGFPPKRGKKETDRVDNVKPGEEDKLKGKVVCKKILMGTITERHGLGTVNIKILDHDTLSANDEMAKGEATWDILTNEGEQNAEVGSLKGDYAEGEFKIWVERVEEE